MGTTAVNERFRGAVFLPLLSANSPSYNGSFPFSVSGPKWQQ